MRKLLAALAVLVVTSLGAAADGTINPLPGIIGRVRFDVDGDGLHDRLATSADGLELHLYYGSAELTNPEELTHHPQFAVIDDAFGRWIGLPTIFPLPGRQPNTLASLQFRILTPTGLLAETDVRQVLLGPGDGPGTIVWQPGSISNPSRFPYLNGPYAPPPGISVPEPSALVLGLAFSLVTACGYRRNNSNHPDL